MENTKLLVIDIETDVVATPTLITFDKQKYIDIIDQMPLEQLTAGFFKKIEDSAINIDKTLSAPIKAWRLVVKEIVAHGESRIAELKRKDAEIEAKRVAEKTVLVNRLIGSGKACYPSLPSQFLSAVVSRPEYLQKNKTEALITSDILAQLDLQKSLYQAELDAKENEILKIKNRELLVQKLNVVYGLTCNYADYLFDRHSDEEVEKSMLAKYNIRIAKEQAEAERQAIERTCARIEAEAQAKALAEAQAQAQAQAQELAIIQANAKVDGEIREKKLADLREHQESQIVKDEALAEHYKRHAVVTNPYPESTPKFADKVFSRHIDLFCTDEVALEKAVTFIQSIILKNDTITITIL